MHTGTGAIEHAIQSKKNLKVNLSLTEEVIGTILVMRYTTHTGLKFLQFDQIYRWSELSVSAEKHQIPLCT